MGVCFGRLPKKSGVGAAAENMPVSDYTVTLSLITCSSPKTVKSHRGGTLGPPVPSRHRVSTCRLSLIQEGTHVSLFLGRLPPTPAAASPAAPPGLPGLTFFPLALLLLQMGRNTNKMPASVWEGGDGRARYIHGVSPSSPLQSPLTLPGFCRGKWQWGPLF